MKVTEYEGHKVPEGATYYNAANMFSPEAFYNHDATARNKVDSANGWMPHSGGLPTTAIELPEQQEDNAEWVPVVGELCEITYLDESVNCLYLGVDVMGNYAYQVSSGEFRGSFSTEGERHYFRPLKTDEQKAKEAFKAAACKAIHESDSTYNDRLSKITEVLFYAGFTAPEGEL
jgi:hypothetical protein